MTTLDWLIVAATLMSRYPATSGVHRRRAVAGRVHRRRDRRHAGGRRAAGGRSRLPYRAAVRADRRPGRRRDPGDRLEGVGIRLRRGLRLPFLGLADGLLLGALLSAAVALALAWVLGVVVLALPGTGRWATRSAARRSCAGSTTLPPSGVVLHALARIDPLPAIAGVGASVAPPPASVAATPALARAERSVVRVIGTACGTGSRAPAGSSRRRGADERARGGRRERHDGRGWRRPAWPRRHGGPLRPAQRPGDPERSGLREAALALAGAAVAGTSGRGARLPARRPVRGGAGADRRDRDGGDRRRLRARPAAAIADRDPWPGPPGKLGRPVVDAAGAVLTTVFAATTGAGPRGGYGVANATVRADLAHAGAPVSTQGCTS